MTLGDCGYCTLDDELADAKTVIAALLAALEELERWTEATSITTGATIEEEARELNPKFYAAILQARSAIAQARENQRKRCDD